MTCARSLLLKLVLRLRADRDTHELLVAQQRRLGPIVDQLTAAADQATGADRLIAAWRAGAARAFSAMLGDLIERP